jgi:hypothetical protein
MVIADLDHGDALHGQTKAVSCADRVRVSRPTVRYG